LSSCVADSPLPAARLIQIKRALDSSSNLQ
jgi:hypothetical protein